MSEETLLQLGNMDGAVSADVLAQVSAEYFEEFNRRYGSHVHILDRALHLDEATPHIHERHVFDAVNQYGELCPQQDKALEELGFELPKPNEKKESTITGRWFLMKSAENYLSASVRIMD